MTFPHGMSCTSASAGAGPVANTVETPCQICGSFSECDKLVHVRHALSEQVLASIIKSFSVSVSKAYGAGPAGYLSDIQAAQVANMLYDATIDLVADRFAGNVTRFKAAASRSARIIWRICHMTSPTRHELYECARGRRSRG